MQKLVGICIVMLLIGMMIPTIRIEADENNNINLFDDTYSNHSYKTSENGIILDQVLDENNKGYSVISVWGSHYEMGYAQAELLGDYIVQAINENKQFAGFDYTEIREIMSDALWMPLEIEDELNGIVDCLTNTHPSENIDKLDLKVLNTLGDWSYGFACRSHTCWGRYVSNPVKTLSTRRLDFQIPYPSANHHVLCARDPDDGSTKWVNLAMPGYVLVATCVNEYGVLVSSHDYNTNNPDFSKDGMSRMVAFRYAATFATNPDISKQLNEVYLELQNYEMMIGGFLNYYAPEGYGGVMTFHPNRPDSDFYDLRIPQESWYHGDAMITTNKWTDGTFNPSDEDFGVNDYYMDESSKTLESHWELLHFDGAGGRGMHQLSLAYRDREDMTIWADGKLSNSGDMTDRMEWEWDDLFFEPPNIPTINGPSSGVTGENQEYIISSTDPDGNDVSYWIDWGDNTEEIVIGPFPSGQEQTISHTWASDGEYTIRVKAQDTMGDESNYATLQVTMPKTKSHNHLFLRFLENHPRLFPILRLLLT
jgi:hypothetical protein